MTLASAVLVRAPQPAIWHLFFVIATGEPMGWVSAAEGRGKQRWTGVGTPRLDFCSRHLRTRFGWVRSAGTRLVIGAILAMAEGVTA
jgi:hypothetical protein